jgi:ABC-type multidrug transport system fused ATPase/permease subunit
MVHGPEPAAGRQRSVAVRGLRVLGSYIALHPWPFAVAITGGTIYALATVATTVVLGRVVDRVLLPAFASGHADAGSVAAGAGAILAVALVLSVGVTMRRFFAGLVAARVQVSLRTKVVDRYRELPLAYHESRPTGELLAHTQADVEAATEVLHPVPFSIAVLLLTVLATAALFATDLVLAAFGAVILPVLVLLNRAYSTRVEGPAARVQARIGDVSSVAHESIDGALVVKTLGRERAEVERLASQAEALRAERVEVGTLRASFNPAFNAVPVLGIVVLLGVGAARVAGGAITVGTLVQFISLFQLLTFPMQLIGFVLSELPTAVVSRDRLQEVFDEPLTMPPAAETVALEGDGGGPLGLSVRDLRFGYGAAPVLDGVSFEVPPGGSVALVGPTAAGKSTLAELLVRLADPDGGSIRLGRHDLRHLPAAELRAAAALVFQESFLFRASVRENITLGEGVDEATMRWAARLAQAERFIEALPDGYDTVVGERGVTLSGGQRQRVALARALARRPRLLILDDATSAVDPTIEAEILDGLRAELRTTLVLIAYRVSTISLADRVLFLDGGRIAAEGSHAELLAHPAYAAMVRAYAGGQRVRR